MSTVLRSLLRLKIGNLEGVGRSCVQCHFPRWQKISGRTTHLQALRFLRCISVGLRWNRLDQCPSICDHYRHNSTSQPPLRWMSVSPITCSPDRPNKNLHNQPSVPTKSEGKEIRDPQSGDVDDKQLGLVQRFKKMTKEYWYVLIPVHCVTSVVWFGSFYYMAVSGIDIVPFLESWNVSETIISPLRNSSAGYIAIAYAMYKIATPARYTVTLGGTTLSIKYLRDWGYIKPMPSGQELRNMYSKREQELLTMYKTKRDKFQKSYKDRKADFMKRRQMTLRQAEKFRQRVKKQIEASKSFQSKKVIPPRRMKNNKTRNSS